MRLPSTLTRKIQQMKKLIYTVLFLCISATSWAQKTPITEANDLYKKGDYEKAIKSYEFVLETHLISPEIYFNLANAYYKTGQIAPAILNYERAKLLAPEDKDIQYNLELAHDHVLDKFDIVPELFLKRWISDIRNTTSAESWSYISIAFFILCLLFISIYLYSNKSALKKAGFSFAFLSLSFCIIFFAFTSIKTNEMTVREHAIIFTPSVTIKGSPDLSGTDLFLLHEGTKVKVIDQLGNWRNIQLSDGNEGWLKKDDIEII